MYLPGIETDNYCYRFADYSNQTRWQDELANNVTTLEELKEYINLTDLEEKELKEVIDLHPMSIRNNFVQHTLYEVIRGFCFCSLVSIECLNL